MNVSEMAATVKNAALRLSMLPSCIRDEALESIARCIDENRQQIIKANLADLERSRDENIPMPVLKRLKFDDVKIDEVISGLRSLKKLDDPIGRTMLARELDKGLELYKVTCPIGVIGIIFESRPDALVQISSLCLKSGNGVLLKGGQEAMFTNRTLAGLVSGAAVEAGIPDGWLRLFETRADVNELLKLDDYVDLLIPRGSNEFVRYIMDNTKIQVLGHAEGICHCYIDRSANISMALDVTDDSKTQYAAVCNATETLLVHKDIAPEFLPALKQRIEGKGVELVGCSETRRFIDVAPASEKDWRTEYLDYKLSIKVVNDINEAIGHINTYSSHHTDAIITEDRANAALFLDAVDSGNVFWNCSTRFSDGFRYGFGAEVGISTSKIHARGPVGLDGLVTYKYKLLGSGQTVAEYMGANKKKSLTHKELGHDCPV